MLCYRDGFLDEVVFPHLFEGGGLCVCVWEGKKCQVEEKWALGVQLSGEQLGTGHHLNSSSNPNACSSGSLNVHFIKSLIPNSIPPTIHEHNKNLALGVCTRTDDG